MGKERNQNDSEDSKLLKMLNEKASKIQLQTTVWEFSKGDRFKSSQDVTQFVGRTEKTLKSPW